MSEEKLVLNRGLTYKRVFVYFLTFILVLAYIFPIYWMVITAFKTPAEVSQWPPTFIPNEFTIKGFQEIIESFRIIRWFANSIYISVSVTFLTLFVTSLAAFAFAYYRFPAKKIIFMYLLASLMVPIQIRMIPTFLLIKQLGWLESYRGLIIPQIATSCGMGILLLRQFYVGIPKDLFDSARIDGCGEFQLYTKIALPLIKPALIALSIFVFTTSWNNFIWPLLVVQSESLKTLTLGLVGMSEAASVTIGLSWPAKMAGATLVILPILLLYSLFKDVFIKGISMTGIKG